MNAVLNTLSRPKGPLASRPTASPAYRGDIDGLRAVAVSLVVLFHAGWPGLPGGYVGVDVFFVLSGYLITGLLLRELQSTGSISIGDFYARRVRRLLPLSATVLVCTAVASYFLTPALDRPGVGSDIRAAALYAANWHYAAAATQYMADTDKSPVLHYWSLSVEEQFYVVWPLVILLLVGTSGLALRSWTVARRRVTGGLAVIGLVSLVLSAKISAVSGPFAYFGLHTRAWELAAGGALAIALPRLKGTSTVAGTVLGGAGIAAVVGSAVFMTGDTVFPGTAALVPVLGTVMVVAAGAVAPASPLTGLLSRQSVRYVGRLSYAWYLWHWPCLVLIGGLSRDAASVQADQAGADQGVSPWWAKLLAVLLSLLLAILSHHLLENPVRRSRWLAQVRLRSLSLGVALTVISVVASLTLLPSPSPAAGADSSGAAASQISVESARRARSDTADIPRRCYQGLDGTTTPSDCLFGDPKGNRTIVLVGDSNARHWFPAFDALAKKNGWKFYFWGKSGCTTVDALLWLSKNRGPYDSCTMWRQQVLGQMKNLSNVDAVVLARSRATDQYVMANRQGRAKSSVELAAIWGTAVHRTVQSLEGLSPHVVIMRPIPQPPTDVPACIAEDPKTAVKRCAFPRAAAIQAGPLDRVEDAIVRSDKRVSILDLNHTICPSDPCPVLSDKHEIIYLNRNHLTARYTASESSAVSSGLQRVVG